ncbi:hypothetical protein SAMN05428967_0057 [Phyllobacterium sp. YR620]|uniref:SGNH/GDSL hydrolase family protein n=1 Tax=Phyllobacterium sp. YR620 TaxID=1881066 RepID=UPI0008885F50|nr:DUF459 domain-containing protein [Phyllobacterium sp. YR620]SDO77778.1 hypothetical protein SAMN05428967_0057 [Phyllobacterium sp. YR620]
MIGFGRYRLRSRVGSRPALLPACLVAAPTVLRSPSLLAIAIALAGTFLFIEHATARTLLDMLFGPRIYRENTDRLIDDGRRARSPSKSRPPLKRARPRPDTVRTSPVPNSEAPIQAKLPDAKPVLVVGDFMAGSLAEGLDAAFIDAPGVRVIDKADGSSGFVRSDHRDWPASIGEMIAKEKPAVVVIMIGANDRQQFSDGKVLLTDDWTKEYQARMNGFLDAVKKAGQPVVWVGQPAFKSKSITNDVLAFNDFYRNATEKAGGTFVDVWDGFVDQSGNFTLSGFDVSGQTARLRNNDGIGMTAAGKRKLAFYVEKPLRQMLGNATSPDIAAIKPGAPVQALTGAPGAPSKIDRLAPVSLNDPELDGGTDLLGAAPRPAVGGDKSARDRLVIDGVAPEGQPGRVNDFSWPKQ